MVTQIIDCKRTVYKRRNCERLGFGAPKVRFHRVKDHVSGDETWSLGRSELRFRGAKAMLSQNEE